jgi:hypothetical protein
MTVISPRRVNGCSAIRLASGESSTRAERVTGWPENCVSSGRTTVASQAPLASIRWTEGAAAGSARAATISARSVLSDRIEAGFGQPGGEGLVGDENRQVAVADRELQRDDVRDRREPEGQDGDLLADPELGAVDGVPDQPERRQPAPPGRLGRSPPRPRRRPR